MSEYVDQLKDLVERTYHCKAEHHETVAVTEVFKNKVVWDGYVVVFSIMSDAKDAPKWCYAWQYMEKQEGDTKRGKAHLVPHKGHVDSPQKAVQTVIAKEYSEAQKQRGAE